MLVSLREPLEVPAGLWGNMVLMSLTARPPRRGDQYRPHKAVRAIRNYAATEYYFQHGEDHPENPRLGNRSRADRRASLELVFSDFKKGVEAGRLFLSSLYATSPSLQKQGYAKVQFRGFADLSLSIPAVSHIDRLNEFGSDAGQLAASKYIRQARWDNWLETIHIGAAFALLIDGNELAQGAHDWKGICRSILFREENEDLADVVAANANTLLEAAIGSNFFQKAKPRPVVIVG
jgi:hypothetical protein